MWAPPNSAWRRLMKDAGFTRVEEDLPGRELARNRRGWIRHLRRHDGRGFYLKAFTPRGIGDRVRFTMGKNPLETERRNLMRMAKWDVPAARPVGMAVDRGRFGVFRRSFLLVEEVEGTRSLEAWLGDSNSCLSPAAQRRALEDLGSILSRLHEHGFVDRDMHFRNILVRKTAGRLEFFLIDSPKGRRPWTAWGRKRGFVHDLACLDKHAGGRLTRSQRMRFLRAYLGHALTAVDKRLVKAIAKRTRTLMRRREEKLQRDALRDTAAYQRSRE